MCGWWPCGYLVLYFEASGNQQLKSEFFTPLVISDFHRIEAHTLSEPCEYVAFCHDLVEIIFCAKQRHFRKRIFREQH